MYQSAILTGIEAQLLVVIQHCVHVLNPDRVHRAIKHQPPGAESQRARQQQSSSGRKNIPYSASRT
jgi:hypothetical protein